LSLFVDGVQVTTHIVAKNIMASYSPKKLLLYVAIAPFFLAAPSALYGVDATVHGGQILSSQKIDARGETSGARNPVAILSYGFMAVNEPGDDEAEDEASEDAEAGAEDAAEEAAEDAADSAEEAVADSAEEAAEDAADSAEEAVADSAEEAAEDAADSAEEAVADSAEEAAEDAADSAEEAVADSAEEAVEDAADSAEEAVADSAEEAAVVADNAAQIGNDGAEETTDTVMAPVVYTPSGPTETDQPANNEAIIVIETPTPTAEVFQEPTQPSIEKSPVGTTQVSTDQSESGKANQNRSIKPQNTRLQQPAEKQKPARSKGSDMQTAPKTAILREYHEGFDESGDIVAEGDILILADIDDPINLDTEKFDVQDVLYLEGLGMVLTRVNAADPDKLGEELADVSKSINAGSADMNHIYAPEAEKTVTPKRQEQPREIAYGLGMPANLKQQMRIGLIDTLLDQSHAALMNGKLTVADFVPYSQKRPQKHGTAVAAILVGEETSVFKGLSPASNLYAASVFSESTPGNITATTESLILAIDWLVREKIQVINMSLSGPPNQLLEIAVNRAYERGTIIVAAVGNAGPTSKPLYPAAYKNVIAVTAIDSESRVYLRANRGKHIDFSAPGVDVISALAGGGYQGNSGTSIAAPFATIILAESLSGSDTKRMADVIDALRNGATDIGTPGFDTTYGYGLIKTVAN